MSFLLAVFLAWVGLTIVAYVIIALIFRLLKVGIEEVAIFYGRPLFSVRIGRTMFKLGWLPIGISMKWDEVSYRALSRSTRAGTQILTPLLLVLMGISLIGAESAWHHLITGFRQYFEGVLHPQDVGWALLRKLETLYRTSALAFLGVMAMKMAAIQLMPFGVSAPTSALGELLKEPGTDQGPPWLDTIMIGGAMLVWACSLAWFVLALVYGFKGGI